MSKDRTKFSAYRRALWPHAPFIAITITVMLLAAVMEAFGIGLLVPAIELFQNSKNEGEYLYQLNQFTNGTFTGSELKKLIYFSTLAAFVIAGLGNVLTDFFVSTLAERVNATWERKILARYLRTKYSFFIKGKTGDLILKQLVHTERSGLFILQSCSLFKDAALTMALFIILFFISVQYTAVLTIVLVVLGVVSFVIGRKKIVVSSEVAADYQAKAFSLAAETFNGIKQVRAFGASDLIKKKYEGFVAKRMKINIRNRSINNVPGVVLRTLTLLALLTAIYFLSEMKDTDQLGLVVVFGLAMYRVNGSVGRMVNSLFALARQVPSLRIVVKELSGNGPQVETEGGANPTFARSLVFDNVSFTFGAESEFTLKNISLDVKKGQFVGIVGRSGVGKTTILDLILRFYDPHGGKILLDDKDLTQYDKEKFRRLIGYVGQEIYLFSGSIKENIIFSINGEVNKERMEEAIRVAYLEEYLDSLPDGLESIVSEKGSNLSGGQRQRIAIARAVYRDPEILVFDEATSDLDSQSEKIIQQKLEKICRDRNKTIIVVAHRLSTLSSADVLYAVDKCGVVEKGSHQELFNLGGIYRQLYDRQKHMGSVLAKGD